MGGSDPDPYVKTYLEPITNKLLSKRRTTVVKKSMNPTYNEMFTYQLPLHQVTQHHLKVGVWNYEALQENSFLGGVTIFFDEVDLSKETVKWYNLRSTFI